MQTSRSSSSEQVRVEPALGLPAEVVQKMDEPEWYARAYRGLESPQLTLRAVMLGSVIGLVTSVVNVYVGLKTGITVGVGLTACLLSVSTWSLLHRLGLARPMGILETNCAQSVASSAGHATGNTLVSAIPAMLLISVTDEYPKGRNLPVWLVALWVLLVAVLGVFIAIPMKRAMINRDRLPFPSGASAAVLLQSLYGLGSGAAGKARALWRGAGLAAALTLVRDLHLVRDASGGWSGLLPEHLKVFDKLSLGSARYAPSTFKVTFSPNLMLVGVGALAGLRVTASMLVGASALAFVLGPRAIPGWPVAGAKPGAIVTDMGLYVGAPMLVAAGLLGIMMRWRTASRAFAGLRGERLAEKDERVSEVEVPASWFVVGSAVAGVALVVLAWSRFAVPLGYGVLALLLTFALSLVACRSTGETDVTPNGPVAKLTQLAFGMLPRGPTVNVAQGSIVTAGITSGAALASAELLTDLKAGYLLGARPRQQFLAQLAGVVPGTLASCFAYFVLVRNVDSIDPKSSLPASSAHAWKKIADLVEFGIRGLPESAQHAVLGGLLVGGALVLVEHMLPRWKKWLPSPAGLALGFILPFYIPEMMFFGAAVASLAAAFAPARTERFLVPIASGLIIGESVLGFLLAIVNQAIGR